MLRFYSFKYFLLFLIIFIRTLSDNLQAQQLGLANSNYVGTHSLYTNPASIADSRQAFYLNLFSIDAGATNNYFRYDAPISLYKLFKDGQEFKEEYLKENLNGKPKLVKAGADFRGPSFMFRLSSKHSFAFTSRVRGGLHITNLSEDIARLYKLQKGGAEAEDLVNQVSGNNTMNLNANVHAELGLSYARVILNKEQHFVKGGFIIKKLSGGYSAHLINENTQFRLEQRPVAGSQETENVLQIDNIQAEYGYLTKEALGDNDYFTKDAFKDMKASDILKMLTRINSPGKGWGTDLGFTYEYRPKIDKYRTVVDGKVIEDHRKNKYSYRVGIALMDVGGINYNNSSIVNGYEIDKQNKELKLSDFEAAESTGEYAEILNRSLGVTEADRLTSFRSGLPTALNVNVDYRISRVLYANATWIQDLRSTHAIGMRQNSLLALTPRLELKALEASFPVALQNDYSVLTVGAMLKVGPLFVGSDNIGGAFNIGDPYGANAYMGMALSIAPPKNKRRNKGSDLKDK